MLRSYICVDYPGYVKNDEKAILTLGGMDRIKQTFQRKNRKLFLNFQPDNLFSKMLCSDIIETTSQFNHNVNTSKFTNEDNETSNTKDEFENKLEEKNVVLSRNYLNHDLITMPCLLMRVKKKKKSSDKNEKSILTTEIIGSIERIYTFQKIADFQYLPMYTSVSKQNSSEIKSEHNENKDENKKNEVSFHYNAFYDNFKFNHIDNYEHDLRKNSIPQLFVLPPFFSRFDDPVNYAFRSEPIKKEINKVKQVLDDAEKKEQKTEGESEESDEEVFDDSEKKKSTPESNSGLIRSMRQERPSQAYLLAFNCNNIPEKSNEKLKEPRNPLLSSCVEKLKELFNERPCYLKSVLLCTTNFSPSMLKEALPYVAYYFTTGPWRSCWVRFGYDPRLCPQAKIYQMIDYRLRYSAEPEQKVKPRPRSSYHKRKWRSDLSENESDEYKNYKFEKEMYKFNPNKLPTSRNVFYQLCDIEDSDVQYLIRSDENKPNECSEKDGWCLSNIQDKCRNIMNQKHENLFKNLSIDNKVIK